MYIPFMRRADMGLSGGKRRKLKLGIALGAGAARGWSHIGFLHELDAHNIVPDVITGTSMGAVCGGAYAGGKLIELEGFARSLTRRRVLRLMDLSLAGGGIIRGGHLRLRLEEELGDIRAEGLRTRFGCIATEIGSGHEIWLTKGRLAEIVRASYALPGLFEPVQIDGRWMVDGALVNPIPITMCRALGADVVIAVNLSTDSFAHGSVLSDHLEQKEEVVEIPIKPEPDRQASRGFFGAVSDGASSALGWPFRSAQNPSESNSGNGPGIAAVMVDAFNIMQDRVARSRLAGDPPDVLVTSRVGKIGLFDFHRADELIALGREAARRSMSEIRSAITELESTNM